MEQPDEYVDPDYQGNCQKIVEDEKRNTQLDKIIKTRKIVRKIIGGDIEDREKDVKLMEERLSSARELLHRLRKDLVTKYYEKQKLKITPAEVQDEVELHADEETKTKMSRLLRHDQHKIHPSVKKLLNKKTVEMEEIFKNLPPRANSRVNYTTLLQKTASSKKPPEAADKKRPESSPASGSKPKKIPRHMNPKTDKVVTLNEVTRNKQKDRYRIIIGNTSKYTPPASSADRSTHKWLLYVRGVTEHSIGHLVTRVCVTLHHSYAPHHVLHVDKPPFHISRRGWGEFPAKLELHFAMPELNRPAQVEHTIKLDRKFTGLQTLGAETLIDVWLFSNDDMLPHVYKDDIPPAIPIKMDSQKSKKKSPERQETSSEIISKSKQITSWLELFNNDPDLDVDEHVRSRMKKMSATDSYDSMSPEEPYVSPSKRPAKKHHTHQAPKLDIPLKQVTNPFNNIQIKSESCSPPKPPPEPSLPSEPPKQEKKFMKYMDPTTKKIYYLEVDKKIDLSKIQEIVIKSEGKTKTAKVSPMKSNGVKESSTTKIRKGVSLLKPQVRNLKNSMKADPETIRHINNDHSYLTGGWEGFPSEASRLTNHCGSKSKTLQVILPIGEKLYSNLCTSIKKFTCIRAVVSFLLKKIPVVSPLAYDSNFLKYFPFVVRSADAYWKLDVTKRKNIEWSRAKLINKILREHYPSQAAWRTKQILLFANLHGYFLVKEKKRRPVSENEDWSSWNDIEHTRNLESKMKELYPKSNDISTLTLFERTLDPKTPKQPIDLTKEDEEVEVVSDTPVKVKRKVLPSESPPLQVLPASSVDEQLRLAFIERTCAKLGIELRNQDVGYGFSYSAVHAVMLSAMKSFVEEVLRKALAEKTKPQMDKILPPIWPRSTESEVPTVCLEHVWNALKSGRFKMFSQDSLGVKPQVYHPV